MKKLFNHFAFRTTLVYVIFAGIWISTSDSLLGFLVSDPRSDGFDWFIKGMVVYCG